jgi:hypothetical protein
MGFNPLIGKPEGSNHPKENCQRTKVTKERQAVQKVAKAFGISSIFYKSEGNLVTVSPLSKNLHYCRICPPGNDQAKSAMPF